MLIALDHGNRLIKGANFEPFISGLVENEVKPFGANVLKYKGKYYQLSEQRIPYRRDKTEDERFFVLSLFGIVREIEKRGAFRPGTIQIELAVGLPPAHYGAQYKDFSKYFSNRGPVSFSFNNKSYTIQIDEVACFPQAYAAAVTIFPSISDAPQALILDWGGLTVDYLRIKNGEGDLTVCDSLESGVILLYNKVEAKVRAMRDLILSEMEIDAILNERTPEDLATVRPLVERCAQEFVSDTLSTLRERQLELRSGPVVFVGGGSILLRKQIEASGKVAHPIFVEDIRANARGFEMLYKISHTGR